MNQKLRAYVIPFVIGLVILAGIGVFYYINGLKADKASQAFQTQHLTTALGVSVGSDDYLTRGQDGTKVGAVLPPMSLVNSKGEQFQLFQDGKKVLMTFAISNCASCKEFTPLFLEWAKRYGEELNFVLVYKRNPGEVNVQELVDAGIQVILDPTQLEGKVESGNLLRTFFIDATGNVQGRFVFDVQRWEKYAQLVADFAVGSAPLQLSENKLELGEVTQLPAMVDLKGETFRIEGYRGKVTLLFTLSPGCQTCELTYDYVKRLEATYGDQLNLVVILNHYTEEMDERKRDYYNRYNLSKFYHSGLEVKSPEELTASITNLKNVDIYFDTEHLVYNSLNAWITPTMLILDEEGRLQDIFGLGVAFGQNAQTLELIVEQILLNIL